MSIKRIISLMLAVTICAAAAMSAVFIIEFADHDCAGDDCPVCLELKMCLKTLGDVFAFICAACVVGYMILPARRCIFTYALCVGHPSPVNLYDKLTA